MTSLREQDYLRGLKAAPFSEKAAELVNDINAAHPFIEGNGRVQRLWLGEVAHKADYKLQFAEGDRQLWYDASHIGFEKADNRPMARLLQVNLTALPIARTPTPKKARDRDSGPER